jgi:hypothetical protein
MYKRQKKKLGHSQSVALTCLGMEVVSTKTSAKVTGYYTGY